jgi:hypothetical protein
VEAETAVLGERRGKKASTRKDNNRKKYLKEDMERAVRLVKEKGWSVAVAARKAEVPRMTE